MKKPRTVIELDELRNRLREAEETLSAIRNGEVDSLVVSGPSGHQVFSLRGAEQPYRVFVEQMAQGAVTLTPDGTILFANRRTADLLGHPLERLIGAKFDTFLSSADRPEFLSGLSNPMGGPLQLALRCERRVVPVSLSISTLPIDETPALCMVITDLTEVEQKRDLVLALQKLTTAQEQLSLQNEQLREARKKADAANEAKDEFLATLSHELRTPLTPVLVAAQSLEQDPLLPRAFHSEVAMIRRNIELEARLIDDLLDLTKIVRGKVDLRTTELQIDSILDGVMEICEPDLNEGRITLTLMISPNLPRVRGDPVRIQQILWNIVRNAIKFTSEGGRVTVAARQDESEVVVEVSDTGIGMTPEVMERIFTPFEQAGKEITRRFGGLGLGLVISRKLAELHGGRIEATSPGPSQGSTFSVHFPAIVHAVKVTPEVPAGKIVTDKPRLRILLVEDHEDTRRSMTRLLSVDHDVMPADSVATALERAESHPFELIISDLGLPDGTGHELMRAIRRRHGSISGICLSGYGMAEDVSAAHAAGFQKHLTKPVSINHLRAAIAEIAPRRLSSSGV